MIIIFLEFILKFKNINQNQNTFQNRINNLFLDKFNLINHKKF